MEIHPFPSWNYNGNYGISIWEYTHSHFEIIMVIMIVQYGNTSIPILKLFQCGNFAIPMLYFKSGIMMVIVVIWIYGNTINNYIRPYRNNLTHIHIHKHTRAHKLSTCTDVAIKQVLPMTHMHDHAHNINMNMYICMHTYMHIVCIQVIYVPMY